MHSRLLFCLLATTCACGELAAGEPSPRPLATNALSPFWQVSLAADGTPVSWQRAADQNRPITLSLPIAVDRQGPALELRWQPAALQARGGALIGPGHRPLLSAEDAAGVSTLGLWSSDNQPLALDRWPGSLAEGAHPLRLVAVDRLGNRSEQASGPWLLDRSGPSFSWRRLDPVDGLPEDLYDGKRAELELRVEDASAGVAEFKVEGAATTAPETSASGAARLQVVLTDAADSLRWQASDRVGNRSSGVLSLRVDSQGPSLRIESAGARLDPDAARLPPDQPLRLLAVDDAAGVEKACVKASIWREACRDLPLDLIGLSPGHYALTLFARDRLGNSTRRRFDIEVAP